jgi:hypothetical protein
LNRARTDGFYFFFLGGAIFVLLGVAVETGSSLAMVDFKGLYLTARCLLRNQDPYQDRNVLPIYHEEGAERPTDTLKIRRIETQCVYLPTAFLVTAPFAALSFAPAHILWMALTAASMIFAAYLAWLLAAEYDPVIAGFFVGGVLGGSELLLISGNAAGLVISLCVVAVCCFVKERYQPAGVVCLAVALMLKPQDAGLVWLYFLLAGGTYRKRALQTLAATVALSLPPVIWVQHLSPDWLHEFGANLAMASARGGYNDPGPDSTGAHGLGMITDLQAVFSQLRDDPRFYNLASYAVSGALVLVWAFRTMRTRASLPKDWLALASIAALSLLPVYHRQYDAKLLLLAAPACAMLWQERGSIRWIAVAVSAAGVLVAGDLPWAILFGMIDNVAWLRTGLPGRLIVVFQIYAVPLILLAVGVFYLWAYVSRSEAPPSVSRSEATS